MNSIVFQAFISYEKLQQFKKQLKYTISFDGLTGNALIYSENSSLSEDLVIPELILECARKETSIPQLYVFDQGVSSADNFKLFNDFTKKELICEIEIKFLP